MAWVILIVAGLLEVVWAYAMKVSDGFTKLTPSILTLVFMVASFAFGHCLYGLDRDWRDWFIFGWYFDFG